ncbi:HD domain-containing protein, partial [Acinetobacter baumannii]
IRVYLQLNSTYIEQNRNQIDNLRKMLLAMVEDVRVVLLKLAERTCVTRAAAKLPQHLQQQIATETFNIYAPLANRLGIGQLKWELEDLCF